LRRSILVNALNPLKDVDGTHPENVGAALIGEMRIGSCTALAVMRMLEATGINMVGKEAVIVGHSELVGKPVSLMLLDRQATVTICHIATAQRGLLADHVRRAEILVVAVGSPEVVKGEWIHPDAAVIDVGINQVGKHIIGDVEFAPAWERAAFITPVPGGVGPVTVSMLMQNTVKAFKAQAGEMHGVSATDQNSR
jgi:methylenetetrahydrofolate dehydrogenase (NADP+)/methenyltetrahydrofolate cyclohydrolase